MRNKTLGTEISGNTDILYINKNKGSEMKTVI